ncbi:zinc finger protein 76 isoform X1 [Octopus sinensis]|uniref:Zinc finger protein 143 n=1 Tax=Octopus sinensis TaxID=2607531 RepID=A0A6P7TGH2_9MOLL|nr:zinc finger protein 76 isoform X1 [Octopus sinensis]XP_036368743.1 zinc finger protein 76 isoform X1 [Octopus sinensis]
MEMDDLDHVSDSVAIKNDLHTRELEESIQVNPHGFTAEAAGQKVIGLLLHTTEGDSDGAMSQAHPVTVVTANPDHTVQAVTLADGTTAYLHPTKDAKFFDGTTVTLDDGTTAIMHTGLAEKADMVTEAEATATTTTTTTKFVDGQPVQLEDGSTAYLHHHHKEGLQAVQLEDGTTAYIAHTAPQTLFSDTASLDDGEGLNLDHLNSHLTDENSLNEDDIDVKPTGIAVITNSSPLTTADKGLAIPGERSYRCVFEGCERLYTTQHHLKVHERSHTGDRPFKCKFPGCRKAFATGYGLKSHTRVHTGEKPYKCPEENCDKAFKTSGDLQKHVRTHTGERPFKCPFVGCERSFTTSNIRKVHIRTHTGERPYTCQEDGCGRAFASATNYKNHVRIHTGEKPYVCTVQDCGKRFTEYSSLYKHHVVHTHSKPYVCNHCGKTYRQTSTLAMHKRTAHGEEVTAESEAAQLLSGEQPPDIDDGGESLEKKPRLHYSLSAADGSGLPEDSEGTLVINTSEGQVCYTSEGQQITMMADNERVSVVAEDNTMVALQAIPHQTQAALQQHGMARISIGGDPNQQVFVVADPSQFHAFQQLAEQQQQHFDVTEGLEAVTNSTDGSNSTSVAPSNCIVSGTNSDATAILTFHTE